MIVWKKWQTEGETHRDQVDKRAPQVSPGMLLLSGGMNVESATEPGEQQMEAFRNCDTPQWSLYCRQ